MAKKDIKKALEKLVLFVPEAWPLDSKQFREREKYMGKIEENVPFLSESALYTILWKEDARTLRALIRNVAEAAGLDRLLF